jgi:hypothetical protein
MSGSCAPGRTGREFNTVPERIVESLTWELVCCFFPVNGPLSADRVLKLSGELRLLERPGSRTAAMAASDFGYENDFDSNWTELLKFLSCGIVDDQVIEDSQDVLPVLDDAFEQRAQLRLADRFPVPLGQDGCGHFDVAP